MREIKFRAWDIYHKKMRGVMDIKWFDNGTMRVNATETDKNYEPLLYKPDYNGNIFQEFEIMQYTGLHDKNGKEVYEGDIIQTCLMKFIIRFGKNTPQVLKEWCEDQGVTKSIKIVGFYCEGVKDEAKGIEFFLPVSEPVKFEVIGNIYDNPELLKESD